VSINVYWSVLEKEWMRASPPISIEKKFHEMYNFSKNPNVNITSCPATKKYLKNLYGLSSIYDYEIVVENGSVFSTMYDQKFFDDHFYIRSLEKKFFSFIQKYIFFTDEKSLEIEAYLPPFLENNNAIISCHSIPASFDIGKWFRNLEFPFFLKENFNKFSIEKGDIYAYVKFNTDEKIVFKRFIPTEKIKMFSAASIDSVFGKRKSEGLPFYYGLNTFKNNILKEIKENLIN
jgi:glycogen debranching enzyme